MSQPPAVEHSTEPESVDRERQEHAVSSVSSSPVKSTLPTIQHSVNHNNGPSAMSENYIPWYSIKRFELTLENKGSVARDHLANERTFLAWMRTSIALASAGVAVTQLFRMTGTTDSSSSSTGSSSTTSSNNNIVSENDIAQILPADYATNSADALHSLAAVLAQNSLTVNSLAAQSEKQHNQYERLGKPIGATFIGLAILFLLIGTRRYFMVQSTLTQGQYPTARKSVLTAGVSICALVIGSFVSILVLMH